MSHSKHSRCRLCGSTLLSVVIPLDPIPLRERYSDARSISSSKLERYPIDVYQCNSCSAVQTQDDLEDELLWDEYTYYSSQNPSVVRHFKEFADWLMSSITPSAQSILDIGSNDGTLLSFFQTKGLQVHGIDPASTVVSKARAQGIPSTLGLFNEASARGLGTEGSFDIITAFNVFAHSSDMYGMLAGVKHLLSAEGIFCFEVQYLGDIVSKNIVGTIFHEHMIHYSLLSSSRFLETQDLEVFDVQFNDNQNGSVIFLCKHKCSTRDINHDRLKECAQREARLGLHDLSWSYQFRHRLMQDRDLVSSCLNANNIDRGDLAAYGAARSGPILSVQYGIEAYIGRLFDDHPSKVNKFSLFYDVIVEPTSAISSSPPKMIVILAYVYYKQILESLSEYIENGGLVLLLWPNIRIISSSNAGVEG